VSDDPNGCRPNADSHLGVRSPYADRMGKRFDLRGRILGKRRVAPADHAVRHVDSVDTALIIEAARLVVTTRLATRTVLERHLYVTGDVADQLLARLEHCEVVGPEQSERPRRVLTTSGELPGVIEEFQRRG
jgi:hypothetical protein